jgi:hypothetical protein
VNDRLGLALGVVAAAAVATWWLGSTRLLLAQGAPTAGAAAAALAALWWTRALALGPLVLRAGALGGWRAATRATWSFVAAAWPVVIVAGAASSFPWSRIALAEATLTCSTPVLAAAGERIARRIDAQPVAVVITTALGIAVTAVAWWLAMRGWTPLPS